MTGPKDGPITQGIDAAVADAEASERPRPGRLLHYAADVPTGQPWQSWRGWRHGWGCNRCAGAIPSNRIDEHSGSGPYAPCWGRAGCHGYEWGCRCWSCVLVDIELEAADIRAAMLAEWERNGAIAAREALRRD